MNEEWSTLKNHEERDSDKLFKKDFFSWQFFPHFFFSNIVFKIWSLICILKTLENFFPPKVKFYRNIFDQFFSHNSSELCSFDDKELVPIRWNNWDFSTFFQTFGNDISSNCPSISWRPIFMVPVMEVGDELPQLFTDLRVSDSFKWKEAIIIKEEHISIPSIQIIKSELSRITYVWECLRLVQTAVFFSRSISIQNVTKWELWNNLT